MHVRSKEACDGVNSEVPAVHSALICADGERRRAVAVQRTDDERNSLVSQLFGPACYANVMNRTDECAAAPVQTSTTTLQWFMVTVLLCACAPRPTTTPRFARARESQSATAALAHDAVGEPS